MENHSPCLKNSPQSLQPSPSILSNLPLENSAALGSPLIKRSKPQDSLSLLPQALHPTQEPLDPTADLAESLFVAVAVSTPSDLPPTAQEDGTIRCICGFTEDDGFTIQCGRCEIWQHGICVGITHENVPDEYLCDSCDPRPLDAEKAREIQERQLEKLGNVVVVAPRRGRKSTNSGNPVGRPRKDNGLHDLGNLQQRKRSNSHAHSVAKGRGSQEIKPFPSSSAAPSSTGLPSATTPTTATMKDTTAAAVLHSNPSSEPEDIAPTQQSNAGSSLDYCPVENSNYSTKEAIELCVDIIRNCQSKFDPDEPLPQHFDLSEAELDDETIPVIARRAVLHRTRSCCLVKLIPGSHVAASSNNYQSRYALFTKSDIPCGRYITELMGEVYTTIFYKQEAMNEYDLLGCPKPFISFHPALGLCVDARHIGNDSRFMRRNCRPNCIARTVVLPDILNARKDPGLAVRLGVFANRDISRGEELTVGWEFSDGHLIAGPVPLATSLDEHAVGEEEELQRSKRASVYEHFLLLMQCACEKKLRCKLERMRKWFDAYKKSTFVPKDREEKELLKWLPPKKRWLKLWELLNVRSEEQQQQQPQHQEPQVKKLKLDLHPDYDEKPAVISPLPTRISLNEYRKRQATLSFHPTTSPSPLAIMDSSTFSTKESETKPAQIENTTVAAAPAADIMGTSGATDTTETTGIVEKNEQKTTVTAMTTITTTTTTTTSTINEERTENPAKAKISWQELAKRRNLDGKSVKTDDEAVSSKVEVEDAKYQTMKTMSPISFVYPPSPVRNATAMEETGGGGGDQQGDYDKRIDSNVSGGYKEVRNNPSGERKVFYRGVAAPNRYRPEHRKPVINDEYRAPGIDGRRRSVSDNYRPNHLPSAASTAPPLPSSLPPPGGPGPPPWKPKDSYRPSVGSPSWRPVGEFSRGRGTVRDDQAEYGRYRDSYVAPSSGGVGATVGAGVERGAVERGGGEQRRIFQPNNVRSSTSTNNYLPPPTPPPPQQRMHYHDRDDPGIEYGSPRSRTGTMVRVEDDESWFERDLAWAGLYDGGGGGGGSSSRHEL